MFKTYSPEIEQKIKKYDDREHAAIKQANQISSLLGEGGVINQIGKSLNILGKLRGDAIRTPLEIAREAKKVQAHALKLQSQVDVSQIALIDLDFAVKDREENALKGGQSDILNVAVAQRFQQLTTSEKALLLQDKQGINAANSLPLLLTGIKKEQLENYNLLYLKENHSDIISEKQVVVNSHNAIASAELALKHLHTVATDLTLPLSKAMPNIEL